MVFRTQPILHLFWCIFFELSLTVAVTELTTERVQSGTWALLVQSMLLSLQIILQTVKKKKWTGHLDRCNFKTTWVPHNLPCGCPSNTSPVNEVPVSPFSTKEQKDVPTKALATFIQALVIWLLNYFQSDYEEQLYFVDIPPIFK